MVTKDIPPWVFWGGMVLTCIAGCINAVGFLGVHHQAITHLSGTVSILSIETGRAEFAAAGRALLVIFFFFLGCVLSDVIVRQHSLRLGRRYGVALAAESALLFGSVYYLKHGSMAGDYLASMACGLQNAMATSYSGAVIRTTHMTGIITDLGIAMGNLLRRHPVDGPRLRLLLGLLLGFFVGGVLGVIGYGHLGYDTLLFPATLCGVSGVGYAIFKHRERTRQKLRADAAKTW